VFYLFFSILRLLVFLLTSNSQTITRTRPSAKAVIVEARFNSLLNNGGSFGGDIHVAGDHYADGNFYINSHQVKSHQTQNANPPGGAPGSYTPSYESSLSQTCQYIMDCIYNAGIAASH
jgi:hypothetical protein